MIKRNILIMWLYWLFFFKWLSHKIILKKYFKIRKYCIKIAFVRWFRDCCVPLLLSYVELFKWISVAKK